MDETGFLLQPVVRRTWAPRGQTPVQYSWDRRDRLSVVSALTVSPARHRLRLDFEIFDHNVRTPDFEWFVVQLLRRRRHRIILVLDRWSVHRAAVRRLTARFPRRLAIEWLPAYAPDLNPVESVWSHTKYGDLANYVPDDVHELGFEVACSLQDTACQQKLLRSFFKHSKLRL